jgi:hypothetical protein
MKAKEIKLDRPFNSADYYHVFSREGFKNYVFSNTLSFMTTLREKSPNQNDFNEHKPKFDNIPYKDKK